MPRRAARQAAVVAAGFFAIGAACHHPSSGGANAVQISPDSLEGVVRITGVDAFPVVSLTLDDASRAPELVGPPALHRVAGLRVAVAGTRVGTRFTVSRFTVLSANGVAATDGTLAADGDAIVLVTATGIRHRLVSPPVLFRSNIGHRVWVSGALDQPAVAFGLID